MQFSPIAILDDAAAEVERISYTPYGVARHHPEADVTGDGAVGNPDLQAVLSNWGSFGTGDIDRDGTTGLSDYLAVNSQWGQEEPAGDISFPAEDNIVGYDGYIFDEETQGYCVRFRHYIPELGRWVQRDPAGYIDGSPYNYAALSPASRADWLGLCSHTFADDVLDPDYFPHDLLRKLKNQLPPGRNWARSSVSDCDRAKLRLLIAAIETKNRETVIEQMREVLEAAGSFEAEVGCVSAEALRKTLEELFDALDEVGGTLGEGFDAVEDSLESLKPYLDAMEKCQTAASVASNFWELADCGNQPTDPAENFGALLGLTSDAVGCIKEWMRLPGT